MQTLKSAGQVLFSRNEVLGAFICKKPEYGREVFIQQFGHDQRPLHNPTNILLRKEKTLPVQIRHLGEAEMPDLNGLIFGLHLRMFFCAMV